ncbi:hypothetical protein TSUD_188840 [Trifolium subterraneum]|uniref:ATP-dependent DNA helicase n=1 Tax=Trifolium subterraneum TaxID=3900 RepID=A0A2Z6P0L4_TRISU|nr:hypothetical protein TSUD_188840 [Trifolium subterraneum]
MSNSMSDPLNLWEKLWEILADGILFQKRRVLNDPDLVISPEDLKQLCLLDIDNFLRENGKSLDDYKFMPELHMSNSGRFNNILIENEFKYDCIEMNRLFREHICNLNSEQLDAYQKIIDAIDNGIGSMFFVHGYGGTGKTYLWKTVSYKLRSEGKIVLNVSSSGIASILLPGAPMIHKFAFKAFERTLQDIMGEVDVRNADLLFGGKTVVFGGDFRQILPVVPKGSRADIVNATINSSYLWNKCKVLKLSRNMRLQYSFDNAENENIALFAKWILKIGDGKIGDIDDGEAIVDILPDILVQNVSNPIRDIVDAIYPDLFKNMFVPNFFEDRAILAPTLEVVDQVNDYILSLIPGDTKEYLSCDSITKCDDDSTVDHRWITTAFLNEIKCSGLLNHKLILKIGVPIYWMPIVSGPNVGDIVYIPRMRLLPSDAIVPINFQRLKTRSGLKILITDSDEKPKSSNVNVVYPEVFKLQSLNLIIQAPVYRFNFIILTQASFNIQIQGSVTQ